jgi:hypothetical protein
MKSYHIAQIALRTLAIFLVYRGLEFGISQLGLGYLTALTLPNPPDEATARFIGSFRIMTVVGALIPLGLAAGLWFSAPWLARQVAPRDVESAPAPKEPALRGTLILVAAVMMLGTAASALPKLVFDLQAEHRKLPPETLTESVVFPDILQFFGKVVVGGALLLWANKGSSRAAGEVGVSRGDRAAV